MRRADVPYGRPLFEMKFNRRLGAAGQRTDRSLPSKRLRGLCNFTLEVSSGMLRVISVSGQETESGDRNPIPPNLQLF